MIFYNAMGYKFLGVPLVRSKTMSAIRSTRNQTTEIRVQMALVRSKIAGFIMHPSHLAGRPDFFFEKLGLVLFIDGCFWHGCPKCGHVPKTNSNYWRTKIEKNQARDHRNNRLLRQKGFSVLRARECEIRSSKDLKKLIEKIRRKFIEDTNTTQVTSIEPCCSNVKTM